MGTLPTLHTIIILLFLEKKEKVGGKPLINNLQNSDYNQKRVIADCKELVTLCEKSTKQRYEALQNVSTFRMIEMNPSTCHAALPMNNPSMEGHAANAKALFVFTLPP